jgi:phospholipid/cholesterol/gamma-HCH transport system substrate-binding protein
VRRAIRENGRDFVALILLTVLGLVTTGLILVNQGLAFPSWVPLIGSDRFELRAEFETAQAVTPGQGQTVNIAGIKVGDVSRVELEDGRATVEMEIDNDQAELIRDDATLLLRPRTGLQDMTLELDTGKGAEAIEEGSTVPLASTQPNVQPDQILASLDADTRDYLTLLLVGGGEGLGGRGERLSAGLRRLDPLSRNLARINGKLAERRRSIRSAIHDFGLLSEELGSSDARLADFVSTSDTVLGSFARQEQRIREALRELPSALRATRGALAGGDRLALQLGPASRGLIPSARALGPALRESRPFFEETVEPIRDQIRPFTRGAQEPVRHLKQAAAPLGRTSDGLRRGLGVLNDLFDALAYNPPGAGEGYLFWLAWLNHNTGSLFLTQDAGGPLRRGLVLQSCGTARLAEGFASERPYIKTLQELTNVPTADVICPLTPSPFKAR